MPAMTEGLDMAFAGYYDAIGAAEPRGEVEVFASRAGHTTRWHWDYMNANFTLQLRGTKQPWGLFQAKGAWLQ